MSKIDAVNYALRSAKIEGLAGTEGPDGEILVTSIKVKTVDGHALLLSQRDGGFAIIPINGLAAACRSVFDWIKKAGEA